MRTWHQNLDIISCHIISQPRPWGFSNAETIYARHCAYNSSSHCLLDLFKQLNEKEWLTYKSFFTNQFQGDFIGQHWRVAVSDVCEGAGVHKHGRALGSRRTNWNPERQTDRRKTDPGQTRWDKAAGRLKTHRSHSAFLNTANSMQEFSQRKLRYLTRPKDSSKSQCVLEQCYSTFNAEPGRKALKTSCFPW